MNNVFMCTQSIQSQYNDKVYFIPSKKGFANLERGDYVFVKNKIKEDPDKTKIVALWKAKTDPEEVDGNWQVSFEEITVFSPAIKIEEFKRLRLFRFNTQLLNNISQSANNKYFFKLEVMTDALSIIQSKDQIQSYVSGNNYRKIYVYNNSSTFTPTNDDVYLIRNSNGHYALRQADFIVDELYNKFDTNKFDLGATAKKPSSKWSWYNWLSNGNEGEASGSLEGFYALFWSETTSSNGNAANTQPKQEDMEKITSMHTIYERVVQDDEVQKYLSQNTILYGVPGCGKSYEINKLLHLTKDYIEKGEALSNDYYTRILFHPEYSYGDFVGQIMPETDGDKIRYSFQEGPFVEILGKALQDNGNHYFLVIEEINRGNAPAIFGDLFQLLDRENGVSEYPITNKQITECLKTKYGVEVEKVFIPANLTILATMNTCDQNVFTLDTAFKRRWRLHKIENKFDEKTNLQIEGVEFSWKAFAEALNEDMLTCCKDGIVVEDKQLGAYFVKEKEIQNIQVFAEKVIMYLWNDVVKFNKQQLFAQDIKTLDKAIQAFCQGRNIFSEGCIHLKALYDEKPTAQQAE